jgi:ATP-dependent DNA helicase RecQ
MLDDTMRYPKKMHEAKNELTTVLKVVRDTKQIYKGKELVFTLRGEENAIITSHKTHLQPFFGCGKERERTYWHALLRQALVAGYIKKDIETYGVIKMTPAGLAYIEAPTSFMMTDDHTYDENTNNQIVSGGKGGGADKKLVSMLKDLRKRVSKKLNVPPYIVFQDPSIEDMGIKYPMTIEELSSVHGVGDGKAKKYGKEFVTLIEKYVADNEILRPDDLIVKSTGANSGLKLYIIQNVDRKLPLDDIAAAKGKDMKDFIKEMEAIVYSGTKLNISYWIDDLLDEDQQEELHEYFIESETDGLEAALEEFDGDYDDEELRLYRIKFISEVAN